MKHLSSNRPKIAYINPTVLVKRPVSEISNGMSERGFDTSILIPKKLFGKEDSSLHHSKLMAKSKVYSYGTLSLPLSSEQPIPLSFAFPKNVLKALRENDIIHMWVPYYLTNLKIIMAKKLFYPKKKLILTMDTVPGYSFSMGCFLDTMFMLYNKLFGWLIFRTPDIVTLYGKSLVPFALKAGVPKENIRVISTGVHRVHYKKSAGESIRRELRINKKTKIALYAGLLVPRKGIGKVIEMASILRKEDVVFLLAGDGPERKHYEKKAKKLGLEKKVKFLGWRKDISKLYQSADVFVLASEGEGLPGVVMEAMSYGLPCVASDIPCIPDLIDDGMNGHLCEKDDVEAFASRIKELLRNDEKREVFGKRTKEKMMILDWKIVLGKYEELYLELSKKKKEMMKRTKRKIVRNERR